MIFEFMHLSDYYCISDIWGTNGCVYFGFRLLEFVNSKPVDRSTMVDYSKWKDIEVRTKKFVVRMVLCFFSRSM